MLHTQIKAIRTIEGANEAMAYLETRDQIAVGCEGDLANTGQICIIQVRHPSLCCSKSRPSLLGANMCDLSYDKNAHCHILENVFMDETMSCLIILAMV